MGRLDRVVFFSINDGTIYTELLKAEFILNSKEYIDLEDINSIVELFHVKQFIDHSLFLPTWLDSDKHRFTEKVKIYKEHIVHYFNNLTNDNIITEYIKLEIFYIEAFWKIINDYKIYKKIDFDVLKPIIYEPNFRLENILSHKSLVDHYHNPIRLFLLDHPRTAEVLLTKYEEKPYFRNNNEIYLPQNLTIEDKESIISNYIESEHANLNYLRLILNIRNKNELKISNKTRLKVKRREQIENAEVLKNGTGIRYEILVSFTTNQEQVEIICETTEQGIHYSYSSDFVKRHVDNNDILFNVVALLFRFMDHQKRIDLVQKTYELDVFEKVLMSSRNEYLIGIKFCFKQNLSHSQIVSYDNILQGLNTSLVNIIEGYFNGLKERFQIKNFHFSFPSYSATYLEKIRFLLPEFEAMLKQYNLYVTEGKIDVELLQISSRPMGISDMPSLSQNKYLYMSEGMEIIIRIQNLFFSDQSPLCYIPKYTDKGYRCFFDIASKECITYSELAEYQKDQIQFLIFNHFLMIKDDNLEFDSIEKICILKDLFENEVGSYWHYPSHFRKVVDQMVSEKMVYCENTLFSKPEQDYFNYYLNRSEFMNGLDLRNSYLHGTQSLSNDEAAHENSYYILLKLLILAVCKIEDDLEINHRINKIRGNT